MTTSSTADVIRCRLAPPWLVTAVGEVYFRLIGLRRPHKGPPRSILVVRLDQIGDVVLCTPFFRELRRCFPTAWITLIVKPEVYNLIETCPYINEIFIFERRTVRPFLAGTRVFGRMLRLAATKLWWRRFDVAISPRRDFDLYGTNLLMYLCGTRTRVSYAPPTGLPPDPYLTTALENDLAQHEVRHDLHVLTAIGVDISQPEGRTEVWFKQGDRQAADSLLSQHGISIDAAFLVVSVGAGSLFRAWPVRNYTQLVRRLHDSTGLRAVLVGGPDESALGRQLWIELGGQLVDMSGQLSLRETAAVIARCRLFVGNDSGPMHLAAAVGVAVVEVSSYPACGPARHANSPVRFGPWKVPHKIVQPERPVPPCVDGCSASEAHCITQVNVDAVYDAAMSLLSNR